ncbi:MAG: hypothetical protein GF330_01280 [Candidatus Eisenbacteria bacterium]|nr:hypothetical protein [Candidatus Eisenbacteria bacterium]
MRDSRPLPPQRHTAPPRDRICGVSVRRVWWVVLLWGLVLSASPSGSAAFGPPLRRILPQPAHALSELFGLPAAHAAEIDEGPEVPEAPGALKRFWESIKDKPLIRRVRTVASWIAAAARFLWAIPKALIQGDSEGLIEALGGILAQASADDGQGDAPPGAPLAPVGRQRAAPSDGARDSSRVATER